MISTLILHLYTDHRLHLFMNWIIHTLRSHTFISPGQQCLWGTKFYDLGKLFKNISWKPKKLWASQVLLVCQELVPGQPIAQDKVTVSRPSTPTRYWKNTLSRRKLLAKLFYSFSLPRAYTVRHVYRTSFGAVIREENSHRKQLIDTTEEVILFETSPRYFPQFVYYY